MQVPVKTEDSVKNQKFIIQPHFRLQEWVADEKGYFADEGLEYVFEETVRSTDGKSHDKDGQKSGAYQTFEKGRTSDVNCACHWTVNVAGTATASSGRTCIRSRRPAFSCRATLPSVARKSLRAWRFSVGYQSGSHYSSIQALEQYLPADKISLSFTEGMLFKRLDNLLEGKSKASTLFSGPYYLAEQLGYRKIIDTTFMIASMITGTPDEEDLKRFFRALKRAPARHRPAARTLYPLYKNEFPVRYHGIMDTRRWGARRAHRVRALYRGSFRAVARLDREAGNLRGRQVQYGTDTYMDAVVRLT